MNKKSFVYQGRTYASLVEFQRANECGRKLACKAMKGEDISKQLQMLRSNEMNKTAIEDKKRAVSWEFYEKAYKVQMLAKRALRGMR